jgi:hypothetical protein
MKTYKRALHICQARKRFGPCFAFLETNRRRGPTEALSTGNLTHAGMLASGADSALARDPIGTYGQADSCGSPVLYGASSTGRTRKAFATPPKS